jgi:hypothetical protein
VVGSGGGGEVPFSTGNKDADADIGIYEREREREREREIIRNETSRIEGVLSLECVLGMLFIRRERARETEESGCMCEEGGFFFLSLSSYFIFVGQARARHGTSTYTEHILWREHILYEVPI